MAKNIEVTADLIVKYLRGQLNEQEAAELEAWANESPAHRQKLEALANKKSVLKKVRDYQSIERRAPLKWQELQARLKGEPAPAEAARAFSYRRLSPFMAAAAVLAVIVLTFLIYHQRPVKAPETATGRPTFKNDVAPGTNRATLTLADGAIIVLDSAGNGILTAQGGMTVIKLDSGKLAYMGDAKGSGSLYNTVSTPTGGQFQLTLPDGTKVWLNAESSLHYPVAFTGSERTVALTGEGYFEVAKDAGRPFIVQTRDNNEIRVLGTHFNIMAYEEEKTVKTTLLEGSVQVSRGQHKTVIKPGTQAVSEKDGIRVAQVDASLATAWKNGVFQFNSEDINSVMRQLKRWYNVDFAYTGQYKGSISGTLQRSSSLVRVLKLLEQTGQFQFGVDGKLVTVVDVK